MIGNKIKGLLNITNKTTNDLCEKLNILNVVFYRKVKNNTFKADELIKIADLTDTQLAFVNRDGKPIIIFDNEDIKKEPTDL